MSPRNRISLGVVCIFACLAALSCGGGGGGGGGAGVGPPLSITTTSLPDGYSGQPYNQALQSSGGRAPIAWTCSGPFPFGLVLSQSGQISGTTTDSGSRDVTFQATDSSLPPQRAQKTIRMTFQWPLNFTSTPEPAHIGAPYDSLFRANQGVDASSWKVSSGALPPGLALTNATTTQVEIAGTPTQLGTFDFAIRVESSNPTQVATHSYSLTVDSNLVISPALLQNGVLGSAYSVQLGVLNGTPPYTWSSSNLPLGLSFDAATGLVSGTPTSGGTYSVDVTATDSASPPNTGMQHYTLLVIWPLQLGSTLPDAVLNQQYYASLNASGGVSPLAWSITSGSLPPGIVLMDTRYGTFSGQPTQLGAYTFSVQVKDSSSVPMTAEASVTLTVKPPPLEVPGGLPWRIPAGVPFRAYAVARGGIPPYAWSISSGSLPPGLDLAPSTGEVSGVPTTLGSYSFAIQVTDSANPVQTSYLYPTMVVATPKGRNDSITKATPISNGDTYATISPYADPPDNPSPVPDSDYYKVIGQAGSIVKIEILSARRYAFNPVLDSVLEIVDANGQKLATCRLPGDTSSTFASSCMDDDIVGVTTDSELEIKVPGAAGTQMSFYPHVLDFRGDARPDMQYIIEVTGAVPPLVITSSSSTLTWATGRTLSHQFAASGGTPALIWTLDSGTLPTGLALSSDGTLAGVITAAGTYDFVLRVTDAASPPQTVTAPFTIVVEVEPRITTASLPDAHVGVVYSYQLEAAGGTPPFYWMGGAQACCWLYVNSDGVLQGMPQTAGTFIVNVQAQDRKGISATKNLNINVLP